MPYVYAYVCVCVCVCVCVQEEGRDVTTDIYWMLPCRRLVKYIECFVYLTLLPNLMSCCCSYLSFSWWSDGDWARFNHQSWVTWLVSSSSMAKVEAPNMNTSETASLSDERWQHSIPSLLLSLHGHLELPQHWFYKKQLQLYSWSHASFEHMTCLLNTWLVMGGRML